MMPDLDPKFPFLIQDLTMHPEKMSFECREAYQVIYVQQGKLYCRFNTGGSVVREGQLIVIPPEAASSIAITAEIRIIRAFFNSTWLGYILNTSKDNIFIRGLPFYRNKTEPICYLFNKDFSDKIIPVMLSLLKEYNEYNMERKVMIEVKLLELFILLFRFENRNAPVITDPISVILDDIAKNYSNNFEFNDIVRKSGMNATYFCRAFKERTGKPLFEFINFIRIEKACKMLKRTDRTIIDIAFDAGYQNLSFFNRYFRKIMNMSPREYRRNIRK